MASSSTIRYLLDTNILIHYARADALAQWIETRYLLRKAPISPVTSIVVVGEVRAFALSNNWGTAKARELQKILDDCVIVPLEFVGIVDAYADLKTYSLSVGRTLGDNDLWIATTAQVTGTRLLTTDKDFDHLHGNKLQRDWIDPTSK